MKNRYHYASVLKALEELKALDYVIDFNLQEDTIKNNPDNYEIHHVYRYEGDTSHDEEAIVYGIKSKLGEKGIFVAGFSANSQSEAAQILNEINIKSKI